MENGINVFRADGDTRHLKRLVYDEIAVLLEFSFHAVRAEAEFRAFLSDMGEERQRLRAVMEASAEVLLTHFLPQERRDACESGCLDEKFGRKNLIRS